MLDSTDQDRLPWVVAVAHAPRWPWRWRMRRRAAERRRLLALSASRASAPYYAGAVMRVAGEVDGLVSPLR